MNQTTTQSINNTIFNIKALNYKNNMNCFQIIQAENVDNITDHRLAFRMISSPSMELTVDYINMRSPIDSQFITQLVESFALFDDK